MTGRLRWFDLGDGARLPWLEFGAADAPVVVALPGLSDGLMPLSEMHPRTPPPSVRRRRPRRRMLLLSYRHPMDAGTTTADLAGDVAGFVDEVLDGPVVVTGHSMGGMVAQHLAVQRPEMVDRLVLTATCARAAPEMREILVRWQGFVARGQWRGFAADANAVSYTGSELLRRRLLLRLTRPPVMPHLAERHRALTAACLDHDTRQVLDEIACPTAVVAGSRDPLVAPAASRALAEGIPRARFDVLDGLAHGFAEQAPGRTAATIESLLADAAEVRA